MPQLDKQTLQFKSFALELKEPPDEQGRFEGYAAVFGNVDSSGDVIEPGAFAKTLKENPVVPILWQHDPTRPIGVSVEMTEDEHGLKVTGQLELDVQQASEARALMQLGALKGLSIGYQVVKDAADRIGSQAVRRLKEIKLWEWSPVTFPANELAGVSAIKAALAGKSFYDVYWDDDYQQIGALLCMIDCGTQFLLSESGEGETDDVGPMQSILGAIAALLAAELAELGADDEADVEQMSARVREIFTKEGRVLSDSNRKLVEHAVEALSALLDNAEPAKATQPAEAATKSDEEPEMASTLESLVASMKAKAAEA